MNIIDLINKVVTVLTTDETLKAWASAHLAGQTYRVFVGVDDMNPPTPDQYPLLAVTELRTTGESQKGRTSHEIDLAAGVNDDTMVTDDDAGSVVQQGLLLAEQFREQARDALLRSHFGKISISGETGQVSVFPLFVSGMTLTIETINTNI